jgi:hypothetical protein
MKERNAMTSESNSDEVKIDLGYAGRMAAFFRRCVCRHHHCLGADLKFQHVIGLLQEAV